MLVAVSALAQDAPRQESTLLRRSAPNTLRPPRAAQSSALPVAKPKPVGKIDTDAQAVTPKPNGPGVIVVDRHGKLTDSHKPQASPAGQVVPENTRATGVGVSSAGITAIANTDGQINLVRTDSHKPIRTLDITATRPWVRSSFRPTASA